MKWLVLILPIFLAGCLSGVRYDNIELKLVSEIRQIADTLDCQKLGNEPKEMFHKAVAFQYFSEYSSGGATYELSSELRSMVEEFYTRSKEKTNSTYCELKRKNISTVANRISRTMGNKIRL